jgi:opacity protein-like surface antigen
MKQVALFVMIILMTASPAIAQNPVHFGFQAGLNFANATTDPDLSLSSRTGLMVGAFTEFAVAPGFSIQPEIFYIQKGAKLVFGPATATFKLDYVEIPLLAKYKFELTEFTPYLFAGPNVGFRVQAEGVAEGYGESGSTDLSSEFESTDFALDFGAGAEFGISPAASVLFGVRYSLGLGNQAKQGGGSWKNRGIQITAGIYFGK